MKQVNVFIVGEHRLFCDSLKATLEGHRRVRVVGMALDGTKAIEEVKAAHPDVIIVDTCVASLPVELLLEPASRQLRLIHVSLEQNRVAIYSSESVENATTDALLEAVVAPLPGKRHR